MAFGLTSLHARAVSPQERGGWLFRGGEHDASAAHGETGTHPWYVVLWLTGVDYFSTLGYQPGIALLAAGAIAPVATAVLVLVTLAGAVPIYAQVAGRSYVGQGSIAMLENLLAGWWGRLLVLVLLGFGVTDFVITMTLSAADAAQHAAENPFLHASLGDAQLPMTLVLLALLAGVFLLGFSEAIGLAVFVAIPYLALNLVVLGWAFAEVAARPELLHRWTSALSLHGDWTGVLVAAGLIFPRLALGLSGFETGVSVMPLVRGEPGDQPGQVPRGRIRNTRKLLLTAGLIMSVMLILSSFATTLLIPEAEYQAGGKASGRALAYLAHLLLGDVFGSFYDFSTILILWFAGASAMAGLLHLVPRYLPRFGLAPAWTAYPRPLVLLLFAICVGVTLIFRADVEAQAGAYATGVLVLMLSAATAAAIALWTERARVMSLYCWLIAAVFAYTFVDNAVERPDGLIIASIFTGSILLISAVSRWRRATELRVDQVTLRDSASEALWADIVGKRVHLVPIGGDGADERRSKAAEIRRHYKIDGPLAFVHVRLLDNRSEFVTPVQVLVMREGDDYVIDVRHAIAIANTIAALSELIDPRSIFLGLSRANRMHQALRYLFFGTGETGLMVYQILQRFWEETPEEDVRPNIFLMSD